MKQKLRSFIIIIICHSLLFLPLAQAESLALPSGDVVAPEIKHIPIKTDIAADQLAKIRATVTDNVGVKNVTLFYRDQVGATEYKRRVMDRELGTDDFVTTLPQLMSPGIEYFIQATDQAGNTILHGHTFSPLKISVAPAGKQQAGTNELANTPEKETMFEPEKGKVSKWVWIGLGVVALAALGGGGGGGDAPAAAPTATLTITTLEPVSP